MWPWLTKLPLSKYGCQSQKAAWDANQRRLLEMQIKIVEYRDFIYIYLISITIFFIYWKFKIIYYDYFCADQFEKSSWWHRIWSTLDQVMACCLKAPNLFQLQTMSRNAFQNWLIFINLYACFIHIYHCLLYNESLSYFRTIISLFRWKIHHDDIAFGEQ